MKVDTHNMPDILMIRVLALYSRGEKASDVACVQLQARANTGTEYPAKVLTIILTVFLVCEAAVKFAFAIFVTFKADGKLYLFIYCPSTP